MRYQSQGSSRASSPPSTSTMTVDERMSPADTRPLVPRRSASPSFLPDLPLPGPLNIRKASKSRDSGRGHNPASASNYDVSIQLQPCQTALALRSRPSTASLAQPPTAISSPSAISNTPRTPPPTLYPSPSPRGRTRPKTPVVKLEIPSTSRGSRTPTPEEGSEIKASEAIEDINRILERLDTGIKSSGMDRPDSAKSLSDDVLEVLGPLGEGVGGVVSKVKDRRTGRTMARKVIMVREAPLKQLLREIVHLSSNSHPNIVHFYGAYMSPSSSEVKILTEYCKGGSLEAVAKRLIAHDAFMAEKIAGKITEGVE
jgi:hypothetical protein